MNRNTAPIALALVIVLPCPRDLASQDTPPTAVAHAAVAPPDPRTLNPDVPEALGQVILKAMAKEPADRFQTAAQMHDALAAIG